MAEKCFFFLLLWSFSAKIDRKKQPGEALQKVVKTGNIYNMSKDIIIEILCVFFFSLDFILYQFGIYFFYLTLDLYFPRIFEPFCAVMGGAGGPLCVTDLCNDNF